MIVACLWVGDNAVASHDTALAVYDLTDAMPAAIHVSTPRHFRGQRRGIVGTTTWAPGTEARTTKDADATWRAALDRFGDVLEAALDVDLGDGSRFEATAPRPVTAETDEGTHPAHCDADSWAWSGAT